LDDLWYSLHLNTKSNGGKLIDIQFTIIL